MVEMFQKCFNIIAFTFEPYVRDVLRIPKLMLGKYASWVTMHYYKVMSQTRIMVSVVRLWFSGRHGQLVRECVLAGDGKQKGQC